MKKILFFAAVIAATVLSLPSCKKNQTPDTDLTKLWPAADATTGKKGYIDKTGNFKIPAVYDETSNFFSCGYAWARVGNMEYYINKSGNVKYTSEGLLFSFYYNYAVEKDKNGRYGLLNHSLTYNILPVFGKLGNMSYDGLVAACPAGGESYGYVDARGNFKIDTAYASAKTFVDGHACVGIEKGIVLKWGLIDKKGNYTVEPTYALAKSLGHNRWAMYQGEQWVMIDAQGNTKGAYLGIEGSIDGENLYNAENKDHKWGVVDQDGKEVIPFTYERIYQFNQGMAAARTYEKDSTYTGSIIDKKGKVLYSEKADEWDPETPMHNGLILIKTTVGDVTTKKWMDKTGKVIYSWKLQGANLIEDLMVDDYRKWEEMGTRDPQKAPKAENETFEWTPEPFYVVK